MTLCFFFFSNNFIELYLSYSLLLNSFALAFAVVFRIFRVLLKTEINLGVCDNGQRCTSRKTIRISLAAGARSVLVALWDIDDKATMVFMGRFYQHLKRR